VIPVSKIQAENFLALTTGVLIVLTVLMIFARLVLIFISVVKAKGSLECFAVATKLLPGMNIARAVVPIGTAAGAKHPRPAAGARVV